PPADASPAPFDATAFRAAADEFIKTARPVTGSSRGALWIQRTARMLEHLRGSALPEVVLRDLRGQLDRRPRDVTKSDTFAGEDGPWKVWQAFWKGNKQRPTPLHDDLVAPANRWMATRLVRLFPVVVALYEKVKTRHQALDQLDLLVKLRDLLRDNLDVPPLIAWLNDGFDRILGVAPGDRRFDPATGQVFQQRLAAGRDGAPAPAVHVLPVNFGDGAKHKVEEYRKLEAEALARYLRCLVERSGVTIVDPLDGRARPVRYGDIAVLAVTTYQLPLLFPVLDAEGIPYASRGGVLFLSDPLHRQFLLGL